MGSGRFASPSDLSAAATTDTAPLSLLLFLLAAPAAGLPLLLGFHGSAIASAVIAAIVVIAATAVFIFRLGPADRIRSNVLFFCLAVAFLLCLLGGQGRFFFANNDWIIRDALINDLVRQPWPFAYRIGDAAFVLRAPLAIYMLPATIGKMFGVYAAHLAMLAQNTVLFGLLFYFFVPASWRFGRAAALVAIFIIFSGLDAVAVSGQYLIDGRWHGDHFEPWADLFQYSSHITQLFWVPHHAIGGWSFVCLFLLWQRGSLRSSILAVAYLYLAFWSPFAVMGAAPFALYAALSDLRRRQINRFDVPLASLAALPTPFLWAYLLQSGGSVEHGLLVNDPRFWHVYFSFVCIEFVPYVWLTAAMRPAVLKDPTFLIVVISLFLIPFYKIGASDDFAMRASIPALALLAAAFGVMLVENAIRPEHRVWAAIATVILMVGAITGGMEVRRALVREPVPISPCDFVEAWRQSPYAWIPMTSYLVNSDALPGWMRAQSPTNVSPNLLTRCFAQPPDARL